MSREESISIRLHPKINFKIPLRAGRVSILDALPAQFHEISRLGRRYASQHLNPNITKNIL